MAEAEQEEASVDHAFPEGSRVNFPFVIFRVSISYVDLVHFLEGYIWIWYLVSCRYVYVYVIVPVGVLHLPAAVLRASCRQSLAGSLESGVAA